MRCHVRFTRVASDRITNKFFYLTVILLTAFSTGCSNVEKRAESLPVTPSPNAQPTLSLVKSEAPVPSVQTDPYEDANSKEISAATISQSAHSPDDWNLIIATWTEAITLMRSVPNTSPNYASAQKKVLEYQHSLEVAKKQAAKPANSPDVATANSPSVPKVTSISQSAGSSLVATTPKLAKSVAKVSSLPVPANSEQDLAKAFLKKYFTAVINEGSHGDGYWCSQAKALEESLFSPRNYKILSVKKYGTPGNPSYRFQTTVDSSNRGGIPIINNWGFYVMKDEKTKNWCLGFLGH